MVEGAGAGSGHRALELPSAEDALRVSAAEAVRDLAAVTALLESAAKGGAVVAVRQVAG